MSENQTQAHAQIRKLIEEYTPQCDTEVSDKATILTYIDTFPDILMRENIFAHFTSIAFIMNKSRTKTLLVNHNITQSWTPPGGHSEGDPDLLRVAIKEAKEETGVVATPISDQIISLDIIPIWGHYRNGEWVSAHQHLNVVYALEADENDPLTILPEENSDVKWVPIEHIIEVNKYISSRDFQKKVLERIAGKFINKK